MAEKVERGRSMRPSRDSFYGGPEERVPKKDNLAAWAVFIVLLIGLVFVCWFGSLYIFGHPEEPLSYSILQRLKKIEAPKRFIETKAPRGEFLDAKKLLEQYGSMSPGQLRKANSDLLRSYIINYSQRKELVPYVIGNYIIMDSYELTQGDFVQSGVVALMQSTDNPQLLLEQLFPAEKKSIPLLHRSLLTGLEFPLRRAYDLSAIVNVERLADGRLKISAIPLTYGSYAASQGPGSFALEPPKTLNMDAGLPLLNKERIEEADERYANYRRKLAGDSRTGPKTPPSRSLVRVQPAEPASDSVTIVRPSPGAPSQTPGAMATAAPAPGAVSAALPTPGATPALSSPAPEPTVMAAIPVAPGSPQNAVSEMEAGQSVGVPLKPFLSGDSASPGTVQSGSAGSWQTYKPGQMPRGKLVALSDAASMAGRDLGAERLYLQGDFEVSASGPKAAVLRPPPETAAALGGRSKNIRVIVEYPRGKAPPAQSSRINRGNQRPFLIDRIDRSDDGHINVYAREVTSE